MPYFMPTTNYTHFKNCFPLFIVSLWGLYFLPYFLLGERAYVIVHDGLENEFVYIVNVLRSGHWMDTSTQTTLEAIMNGLPRSAFRSGLNVTYGLFALLPPFWAYVANKMIVHFIGGVGMFLLLRVHVLRENGQLQTVYWLALAFSFIPYASLFCGVSISGQPLLLYAFLNVFKDKGKLTDVLIVVLFPFFIAPLLVAPFMAVAYLGLYIVYWLPSKRHHWPYLGLLTLLLGICIGLEWPLIRLSLFTPDFISHRIQIDRVHPVYLNDFAKNENSDPMAWEMVKTLFHGKWHSGNFFNLHVWVLAAMAWTMSKDARGKLLGCMAVLFFVSTYNALLPSVYKTLAVMMPLVNLYSIERFYFLQPLILFLLLGWGIYYVSKTKYAVVIPIAVAFQLGCVVAANLYSKKNIEFKNNLLLLCGRGDALDEPTFEQFMDKTLYGQVKDYIHKAPSSYRVVSLDLPPSAAQFNGFYTLDSYQNNYDLRYKKRFRQVIAKELGKNSYLKEYFDRNGSRCYALSSETNGRLLGKREQLAIECLEWNMPALKAMRCQYVLSAVPILNHQELGMRFEKMFTRSGSYWSIYLYTM